mmetsp:Transcript_4182/g.12186  ORF Transcript_4182/g.12186 Transcript_4182/m.12186 type:complete len:309 (-) Transcript_4182:9-935(-)
MGTSVLKAWYSASRAFLILFFVFSSAESITVNTEKLETCFNETPRLSSPGLACLCISAGGASPVKAAAGSGPSSMRLWEKFRRIRSRAWICTSSAAAPSGVAAGRPVGASLPRDARDPWEAVGPVAAGPLAARGTLATGAGAAGSGALYSVAVSLSRLAGGTPATSVRGWFQTARTAIEASAGASILRLPMLSQTASLPSAFSLLMINLYSTSLLATSLTTSDVHFGHMSPFVVSFRAPSAFHAPSALSLPMTKTAWPGSVASHSTVKIARAAIPGGPRGAFASLVVPLHQPSEPRPVASRAERVPYS